MELVCAIAAFIGLYSGSDVLQLPLIHISLVFIPSELDLTYRLTQCWALYKDS